MLENRHPTESTCYKPTSQSLPHAGLTLFPGTFGSFGLLLANELSSVAVLLLCVIAKT